MAQTLCKIELDVANGGSGAVVMAKQGDFSSRFVQVRLCENRKPLFVAKDAGVLLNVKRPDGTTAAFSGDVNEDGSLTLPLSGWMLEIPGVLLCDVSVIESSGAKLSSTCFSVAVEEAVCPDGISEGEERESLAALLLSERQLYHLEGELTEEGAVFSPLPERKYQIDLSESRFRNETGWIPMRVELPEEVPEARAAEILLRVHAPSEDLSLAPEFDFGENAIFAEGYLPSARSDDFDILCTFAPRAGKWQVTLLNFGQASAPEPRFNGLGETENTAYRGDKGAVAYAHSKLVSGNPHHTTPEEIGAAPADHTHTPASIGAVANTGERGILYGTTNGGEPAHFRIWEPKFYSIYGNEYIPTKNYVDDAKNKADKQFLYVYQYTSCGYASQDVSSPCGLYLVTITDSIRNRQMVQVLDGDGGTVYTVSTTGGAPDCTVCVNGEVLVTCGAYPVYIELEPLKSHESVTCFIEGTKILVRDLENGTLFQKKIEDVVAGERVAYWKVDNGGHWSSTRVICPPISGECKDYHMLRFDNGTTVKVFGTQRFWCPDKDCLVDWKDLQPGDRVCYKRGEPTAFTEAVPVHSDEPVKHYTLITFRGRYTANGIQVGDPRSRILPSLMESGNMEYYDAMNEKDQKAVRRWYVERLQRIHWKETPQYAEAMQTFIRQRQELEEERRERQEYLSGTDYTVIKYTEGLLTIEEFAPYREERQAARDRINAIDAELSALEVAAEAAESGLKEKICVMPQRTYEGVFAGKDKFVIAQEGEETTTC